MARDDIPRLQDGDYIIEPSDNNVWIESDPYVIYIHKHSEGCTGLFIDVWLLGADVSIDSPVTSIELPTNKEAFNK